MDNTTQHKATNQNYSTPSQLQEQMQGMASLTKLLLEISNYLTVLRREFRGEALFQDEQGNVEWVQISKPTFVKLDFTTNKPIKIKKKVIGFEEEQEVYVPNDEAIDEILSILKFSGINQITPISFTNIDNYSKDMLEFECKLAALLCLKRKTWGIDKELVPMLQFKIKTIVRDVRIMAMNGNTIKALITSVQRVEQAIEQDQSNQNKKIGLSRFTN